MRALITGCSTGIGHSLASELTKRGHKVIATARNPDTLERLDVAMRLALDVTKDESVKAAVRAAGPIDVLVNNAGIGMWGPIEAVAIEQVQSLFDVNVFGVQRMLSAVLPQMRERRSGVVIQLSSGAGKMAGPMIGHYAATKHALEAMSEALRIEVAGYGIKVALIELGSVKTSLQKNRVVVQAPAYDFVLEHVQRRLSAMLANPVLPEDVAQLIADVIETSSPNLRYPFPAEVSAMIDRCKTQTDAEWERGQLEGLRVPDR